MRKSILKNAAILFPFLLMYFHAFSQPTNFAGLNFTVENSSWGFRPGLGLHFERQITKRSGIETGIYHRNYITKGSVIYSNQSGNTIMRFTVSERHLSVPFLYKFYSRFINLHAGLSFEFYTGWKQRDKSSVLTVDHYSIDPNFAVGGLLKISKDIRLDKRFYIEPELRFNPILTNGRAYIGFGILGKYKLGN